MRWLCLVALIACGSKDSSKPAPKPPDDMDEKMRHCPLALDGATSTLEDIAGGVRFTITATASTVDEARRRAHHIVDFAARKTREGHGGFDGKGGGRMKNCPVVTDDVTITATDEQIDQRQVRQPGFAHVDALRAQTRERVAKFPFTGATIVAR